MTKNTFGGKKAQKSLDLGNTFSFCFNGLVFKLCSTARNSMMWYFDACYIFENFGLASLDFSQRAVIGENHMSNFSQFFRLKIREIIDSPRYI